MVLYYLKYKKIIPVIDSSPSSVCPNCKKLKRINKEPCYLFKGIKGKDKAYADSYLYYRCNNCGWEGLYLEKENDEIWTYPTTISEFFEKELRPVCQICKNRPVGGGGHMAISNVVPVKNYFVVVVQVDGSAKNARTASNVKNLHIIKK